MVAATVKFALEITRLAEKRSREKIEESDSDISMLGKEKKNSNNKEDGLEVV